MPIPPGTVEESGWISKWAFIMGALAADAIGRQAIEDGYFAATEAMRAKFADSFIDAAKLADAGVTTAKLADTAITIAKLVSPKLLYIGLYDYAEYDRSVYDF